MGRPDGQTDGTDRGNTKCPSAILRIGGGIIIRLTAKVMYLLVLINM